MGETATGTNASTSSGFSFGNSSASSGTASGFSFGTPVATSTATSTTVASSGFSFNTPKLTNPTNAPNPTQSLGGFTFSSTPVIKTVEEKKDKINEEKKNETATSKPSPFSGFSFGSSSTATSAFGAAASVISAPAFGSGTGL